MPDEPLKDWKFLLNTALLALVLTLQLVGAFKGINETVNSVIPLIEAPWTRFLTALGSDYFFLPLLALLVFFDWRKNGPSRKTLAFLIAAFMGLGIVAAMKVILAEPRPRPLPGSDFLSSGAFPSGHTFRAAIIATYVSDRWGKLAPLAWAYAIGIGLTRLLLHYHWLSDVLFSLLLAPWLYSVAKAAVGVRG
ncbi:phosphatase PAP2 family protein [Thermococcus sp. AM4]|uniref:phosphatase PAP2 family protein n=1 Tax=Thermococcus sp. (strain AM4) TaxID=246969 RepID=UPI000187137D|nr:phosphatase PAP2 family protein [Thermococcus sp. AM4]EEB73266.1 type II phosphatidic acid phosphatase [Thermococcus sp. AM4]